MDDWNDVTVLRKRQPNAQATRSTKAVNQAMRSGQGVETSKKYGGGANHQHSANKDTARLDRETEELAHKTVSLSVAKAIMQGRQALGITQKELSTKIAEKPQIVNDYEAGRAIPNQAIMAKLERALGIKLRGKDIGQPLQPKGKKK